MLNVLGLACVNVSFVAAPALHLTFHVAELPALLGPWPAVCLARSREPACLPHFAMLPAVDVTLACLPGLQGSTTAS